jgi:hypothetical protein
VANACKPVLFILHAESMASAKMAKLRRCVNRMEAIRRLTEFMGFTSAKGFGLARKV